MGGPLQGVKVIEMAGLGPAPFCAMMLADMGAEVIRVELPGPSNTIEADGDPRFNVTSRSRRSIVLDLEKKQGVEALLRLVKSADVFIEGFLLSSTEN